MMMIQVMMIGEARREKIGSCKDVNAVQLMKMKIMLQEKGSVNAEPANLENVDEVLTDLAVETELVVDSVAQHWRMGRLHLLH